MYVSIKKVGMIMIRKQIYLDASMDRSLKEIAKVKGVSQAEVIREGLEHYLEHVQHRSEGWESLFKQMRNSTIGVETFDRQSLYQDRLFAAERGETYWKREES
jgi:hypothetical protein